MYRYTAVIAEDDPMVADINRRYLEANPEIELAGIFGNGQEALAYLRAHPVDLAIVDYYMPVLNGRELIRCCRDEGLQLDFIMITANNDAQEIAEILRLGAVDYLVKPFSQERFTRSIRRFVEQKNALRSGRQLSQAEIDDLLSARPTPPSPPGNELDKGLQQATLDLILAFLDENPAKSHSSEEIAREVNLSRITVRRYMNYLLKTGAITSEIDYATGGRPSIRYSKR